MKVSNESSSASIGSQNHSDGIKQTEKTGQLAGQKVSVAQPPEERPTARVAQAPTMLKEGSQGTEVKTMQRQLSQLGFNPGTADGKFGPRTEAALKSFQKSRGLEADGVFGPKSNAALDRATSLDLPKGVLREGSHGEAVKDLQKALASRGFSPGAVDGQFGPRTESALKSFQSSRGIAADGVYGPQSRAAFSRGPAAGGGQPTRSGGSTGGSTKAPSTSTQPKGNGSISYNGHPVSDPVLRDKLQQVANLFGRHITVTSGDRDYVPRGGSQTSLHLAHRAVDLHVDGLSDAEVFSRLKSSGLLNGGYEVIRHGPNTITGGPHIHIGRYGGGRASEFKVEGLSPSGRGVYRRV